MASSSQAKAPREGNVPGNFYVDQTCIDCDTCRWMAPATFSRRGEGSVVSAQPQDASSRLEAIQALLSCPTFSINARQLDPAELRAAQRGLPAPVPGIPGVFHCGWHSRKSFGAAAYLVQRPADQGGNVMVDSPRYNPVLAKQLESLGGVGTIVLSHEDDVADHAQWARHFGCRRVLHQLSVQGDTAEVEVKLQGEGPWDLQGNSVAADDESVDLLLIHTPGHTRGHICMLHRPTHTLFSGDHLSAGEEAGQELGIFTDFNWYSVSRQVDSVRKLLQHDWLHVLPGHGRPAHFRDALHRLHAMDALLKLHSAEARST